MGLSVTASNEPGDLAETATTFLSAIAPLLQALGAHQWEGEFDQQLWTVLRKGCIVRQGEALSAALTLSQANLGQFAVTFVRPAYEELVWLEYLNAHADVAPHLAKLLLQREIANNLEAQNDFIGLKAMASIGFSQKAVKQKLAGLRPVEAKLRALGSALKWRQGATQPTFAQVARHVGREREYNFLYQGTSRYVHFSGMEICRRVWGKDGSVSITSETFSCYWTDFALYWLLRTMVELIDACSDILPDTEMDTDLSERFLTLLNSIAPVPIITATELESW
jgi:hypothetical protein